MFIFNYDLFLLRASNPGIVFLFRGKRPAALGNAQLVLKLEVGTALVHVAQTATSAQPIYRRSAQRIRPLPDIPDHIHKAKRTVARGRMQ